ncbi:hypothetical protein [Streptomyces sp. NPDC091268]|uniref:hypothetical protein n=1 Tax=Streptomyces sp. NPDC091268 TaxID=3365979 RepID=UPI00382BE347
MGLKDEMQDKAKKAKEKMKGGQDTAAERGRTEQDRLRERADEARQGGQRGFDDIQDDLEDRR